MAPSLRTSYGIQNKTGEFPSMRKMLHFCCFPVPPTIPPKWEQGSEASDREGMHLQSYKAKLGEWEETYLITLPISSLGYLHCTDEFRFPEYYSTIPTGFCAPWTLLWVPCCAQRRHDKNTSCLGSNRMVPACTEHSSVWPCLNHCCGFSSLEDDKGQEDHRQHRLPSLFNL